MSTLITIQTIFYLLASIAMIAVGVLIVIILYYLLGILKNTRNISDDISHTYHKTKRNVNKIISSITKNKKHEKSE